LEPDLSALGLSPIACRAADIAAQLLRQVASHDGSGSSSSNHSSSGSRVTRSNKPTVSNNGNSSRSINHEISLNNHELSTRSLMSLATSAGTRSKAGVYLSPDSQISRSFSSLAATAATERVLKRNQSNEQTTTSQQQRQSFTPQPPISRWDIDTAHSPHVHVISPSNICSISADKTEDPSCGDEIAIPPPTSVSSRRHKKSSLQSSKYTRSITNSSCLSSPVHGDRHRNQSLHPAPSTLDDNSPLTSSSSSTFSGVRDRRHHIPQEHDSFLSPKTMTATCLLTSFDQVATRNDNQKNRSTLSDPFPRKSNRRSKS
jgi:hypothetical protein